MGKKFFHIQLNMLLLFAFLIASFLVFTHLVVGQNDHSLFRVYDRKMVTLTDIVDDLIKAKCIFVGELHDRMQDHEAQLAIIKTLNAYDVPLAIGLEMFQKNDQGYLDQWIQDNLNEEEFVEIYYKNWALPWHLYRDIFMYARKNKVPMIGLNVSSVITRQVAQRGFASLSPQQIKDLPRVKCDVDKVYEKFIRRSFQFHEYTEDNFTYFCEAQMVWDTAMAYNLLTYINHHPDETIVVLAGSGHSWKRGIPTQVARQAPLISYRVILPVVSDRLTPDTVTFDDADYLWLTQIQP